MSAPLLLSTRAAVLTVCLFPYPGTELSEMTDHAKNLTTGAFAKADLVHMEAEK